MLLGILVPLASGARSRFIMFLPMRQAVRQPRTFSPTLASVMVGVLSLFLSALWLSLSIGTVGTLYALVWSMGVAVLLSWPIVLFLGPIFGIYVAISFKGRRFLPNYALYIVTIACYGMEYWWLGYLFGHDSG